MKDDGLELWAISDSEGQSQVMAFYESEPPNDVKTSPTAILSGFTAPDQIKNDGMWHWLAPEQKLKRSGGKRYWLGLEGTCGEYEMQVTLMPNGDYKLASGQLRKTLVALLQDTMFHYWSEIPELLEEQEVGNGLSEFVEDFRENVSELRSMYDLCFAEFTSKDDHKTITDQFSLLSI